MNVTHLFVRISEEDLPMDNNVSSKIQWSDLDPVKQIIVYRIRLVSPDRMNRIANLK